MESIWMKENKVNQVKHNIVTDRKEYDVIVIGAGMCGLLCAYYIQKEGLDCLVLEANHVGSGQSGKTTAKITSQHGMKYSSLVNEYGFNKAKLYAQANEEAIVSYEQLIKEEKIDCDFKRVDAYLYSIYEKDALRKEAKIARDLGLIAHFTKNSELPIKIKGALRFKNQAQFSPVRFMNGLAKKLNIIETCKVLKIKGHKIYTEEDIYKAKKIIVATHYPIKNIPGYYFLRQHQERSYVLALSNCEEIKNMYYSIDEDGLSIRRAGKYILVGGNGHRCGNKNIKDIYKDLYEKAKIMFPSCKVEAYWSAQDCMPHDELPFIGKYSMFSKDLYVASGFQKWGMSTSMVAAKIIKDDICGIKNEYASLFSPLRLNVKAGYKNWIHDVKISIKGISKGVLNKKRRCAHMGCELIWNENEKSWDCPCHGSRFDLGGKVLDTPSIKNLK